MTDEPVRENKGSEDQPWQPGEHPYGQRPEQRDDQEKMRTRPEAEPRPGDEER